MLAQAGWVFMALMSALFAGITAILGKIGVRHTNSTVATAVRTTVVLVFSWLIVCARGFQTQISTITANTYMFLGLSGLCTGASWLCYFHALKLGGVNQVTPVDKSSTVLSMLLASLFLGEALDWKKAAAMALIMIGTLMMIDMKPSVKHDGTKLAWLPYAVFSAVFAALTSILGKLGVNDISSDLGTALRTLVVLVMAWAMVFISGKQSEVKRLDRRDLRYILMSGIATGLSWLCYYRALKDGQASIVVPLDKLSIVATIAFSRIILKEKLSRRSFAGFILLLAGTGLILL